MQSRLLLLWGVALQLLGCGAPKLWLKAPGPLVVGQEASVKVTAGGDGSDLKEESLVVRDAAGKSYAAAELGARKVQAGEVAFMVPAGVAPGDGYLEVATQRGPAFAGTLQLKRMIAVRDAAGGVWLPVLDGEGRASPLAELRPEQAGFGSAALAVSPSGGLLAVAARQDRELRLVRLGGSPRITLPATFADVPRDVMVSQSGETLVATDRGIFLVEKQAGFATPPKRPETPFYGTPTVALAQDSAGRKGVALVREGTPAHYSLVRLDMTLSPPAAEAAIPLSWTADPPATVDVAMAFDGGTVLALNRSKDVLVLLPAGASSVVEQALPPGQSGPVAVCAGAGDLFFVANAASRNVSQAHTASGQLIFDPPLDPALPAESGAPVAVAVSTREELLVLFERDLFLFYGPGPKRNAVVLRFPVLFTDKVNGQLGAALVVQP